MVTSREAQVRDEQEAGREYSWFFASYSLLMDAPARIEMRNEIER